MNATFPNFTGLAGHQVCVRHTEEIADYLARYPDLATHLPAIVAKTRSEFPDGQLCLDLYRDPEIDDSYLTLCVRLVHYDTEIMDRIERASKSFEDCITPDRGYLLLMTDFRPPVSDNGVRVEKIRAVGA
jgi:hypothetical protein